MPNIGSYDGCKSLSNGNWIDSIGCFEIPGDFGKRL